MGNNKHDIFISYAREDQPQAQQLAQVLGDEGWSIWWDSKLRPGEDFDEVIEQAIDNSDCVIVIWSSHSVKSRYVKAEAAYALDLNKLVPVSIEAIEKIKIPFRFRGLHTLSLSDFNSLAQAIADRLEAKPTIISSTSVLDQIAKIFKQLVKRLKDFIQKWPYFHEDRAKIILGTFLILVASTLSADSWYKPCLKDMRSEFSSVCNLLRINKLDQSSDEFFNIYQGLKDKEKYGFSQYDSIKILKGKNEYQSVIKAIRSELKNAGIYYGCEDFKVPGSL